MKYLWGPLTMVVLVSMAVLHIAPWRVQGLPSVLGWGLSLGLCLTALHSCVQEYMLYLQVVRLGFTEKHWKAKLAHQRKRTGLYGQRTQWLIERQRQMLAELLATDEETAREMAGLTAYGKKVAEIWAVASEDDRLAIQDMAIWKMAQAAVSARKSHNMKGNTNA